jgi:hypothetical protein
MLDLQIAFNARLTLSNLFRAADSDFKRIVEALLRSFNGPFLLSDTSFTGDNFPDSLRFASGTLERCL